MLDATTLALGQPLTEAYICTGHPEEGVKALRELLVQKAALLNVTLAEPTFETVTLDDQRLAGIDPKDWPHHARGLMAHTTVLQIHGVRHFSFAGAEFMQELTEEELKMLRNMTRETAKQYRVKLTDEECDDIIAEKGPEVVQKIIGKSVRNGK